MRREHLKQTLSESKERCRRWARPIAGLALVFVMAVTSVLLGTAAAQEEDRSMILATTTSVRDSGLLDALLPEFTKRTGIKVKVIAVGTGAALRMGREGNADLLLTHAPASEQKLVDDGIVVRRTPFMENFFVIAGPAEDPADLRSAASPEDAIARVAKAEAAWVSRSDDSGTHKREKALFKAAGLDPEASWKGLVRTGNGMGQSLQVAGQRRTYILSDIGTFLAFEKRIDLEVLSRPGPSLRNIYSVLQLDGTRFERALHTEEGEELEAFLIDPEVQRAIGGFGKSKYGRALFTPLFLSPPSTPTADEAPR